VIRFAGIEEESTVDGEGIRFVLFCQGCPHHCKGCHNPSTWSYDKGDFISPEEILYKMKQNELLDGITLSGGEPFEQVDELLPLLKLITPKYNVWSYSGYIYEDLIRDTNKKKLLQYIDYLIDGPYIEDLRDLTLQFRGSSNQRIINVQESLKQNKVILK